MSGPSWGNPVLKPRPDADVNRTRSRLIATTDAAQELAVSASEPSKVGLLNAIDHAASLLGNTRAVCRASYVHPKIQLAYLDGELDAMWAAGPERPTAFLMLGERRTLHVLTLAKSRIRGAGVST